MTAVASRPSPATGVAAIAPDAPPRGMSLQEKLPLLMATILVVVLTSALALMYHEVRRASEHALSERVTSLARELGGTFDANMRARIAASERVAHNSLVHRALRAAALAAMPAAERDSLATLLASVRVANDSTSPVELWTADGRRVARIGSPLGVDVAPEGRTAPTRSDEARGGADVRISPFFTANDHVFYRLSAPVRDGPRTVGYVVQTRRIGGPTPTATQVSRVLGADIALYFHNKDGALWTTLDGTTVRPPRPLDDRRVTRDDVGTLYFADGPIAGTPWVLSLEAPLATARREPRALLLSLAVIAGLLTVVGALAAWMLGRRVTQPIAQLTAAAEAVSRGDYRSRVTEHGEDEVVRLARSFNRMAHEVDASQRQLAAQYAEARGVAGELEEAYAALQNAMVEVEHARDAAETANRAKSDFLAVMSHELRTPLNAIGGYVELIQMGLHGPVTEAQTQALTRVARSHKHLLGLINDVLNFARLGAGHVQFVLRDVSLEDALTSVDAMLGPQIDAKRLTYRRTSCDASFAVHADGDKLQQIVANLLSNAVKFTPSGGCVALECRRVDDVVEIVVRDTGIGIPGDRLRAIFEPFVQVDRALSRPHDGLGLGLAISRDLARGMGGDVRADSVPGQGSTFTITIPAARLARPAAALTV